MGILYGSVATKIEVPPQLVNMFKAMIGQMKKQLEGRLGVQTDKTPNNCSQG